MSIKIRVETRQILRSLFKALENCFGGLNLKQGSEKMETDSSRSLKLMEFIQLI